MTKLRTKNSPAATAESCRDGAGELTALLARPSVQWIEVRSRLAAAGHHGALLEGIPVRVESLTGLTETPAAEGEAS